MSSDEDIVIASMEIRRLNDQLTAAHQRIEELEHTIHQIACDVGAGGFNAPAVDAKLFYDKISDGISSHIKLWQTQAMEAQQRVAELERFARLIVDNAVLDAAPSQWATARFHKMVIDNARKALRK